jgi:hypothetical protein
MVDLPEPIYLGKSVNSVTYYFLANKEGIRRFIKYVRYPMWCGCVHLVDSFSPQECPAEIVKEVHDFVAGRLAVEVVPKTRGRAERVIKTEVSLEKEGSNNVILNPSSVGTTTSAKSTSASAETESNKVSNSHGNGISAPTKGRRGPKGKEPGNRISVDSNLGSGPGVVRGSLSNESGRTEQLSELARAPESVVSKPRLGRKLADGVLDSTGNGNGSDARSTSSNTTTPVPSPVDGNGSGLNPTEVKQKRKRRTKAEMIAAGLKEE